jgi:hypothetical protein
MAENLTEQREDIRTGASKQKPSRDDSGFARLTALFDNIGIDLLGGGNIGIAAGLVSV